MTFSFRFKQFGILDDKCSMKTGTDAVLIGSWVNTSNAKNILDIGTGSGIIALMLAQRSRANIEGIDIDHDSVEQATLNARHSKWSNRITITEISLQSYIIKRDKKFDLIVSNPPFFRNSLRSSSEKKNISRHDDTLSFEELINGVKILLNNQGMFCIILPINENKTFNDIAIISGLFPRRQLEIQPKISKPTNRIITEYSLSSNKVSKKESLIIRNPDNSFTEEYRKLTSEFYLEF